MDFTKDARWINDILDDLHYVGYSVLENVIDIQEINEAKQRMYAVQDNILHDVGKPTLDRAGEIGVLRLMMKYDSYFIKFLENPIINEIIKHTISDTAILHLQNGFINPPLQNNVDNIFQYHFHRDFPRILNGYLMSVNIFIAISDFTKENGATLVIPGSQQKDHMPAADYMDKRARALECPAGSIIIFDSTLLHAGGRNTTQQARLGINHQFVRSYVKQQIDYVRALGIEQIEKLSPKAQQLLGHYTRVVTNLDEYYRPEHERLYKKGQG